MYIGLILYSKGRERAKLIIDILNEFGMSISYNRVLEITGQLGENVVNKYVSEKLVCPPQLRKHVFTTVAVDNANIQPSATSATTAFNGTCVSVFQHPDSPNEGESREIPLSFAGKGNRVPELPIVIH